MKNILVALDLSPATLHLIDVSRALAGPMGSKLWLVHVAAPEPDFVGMRAGPQHVREHMADVLRKEHVELQAMALELNGQGLNAEALLIQGPTSETLLLEAERLSAELIIMGSHGRSGLFKALLGSVSERVLDNSKLPVLIVPIKDRN